jgi:hypothetical protein
MKKDPMVKESIIVIEEGMCHEHGKLLQEVGRQDA